MRILSLLALVLTLVAQSLCADTLLVANKSDHTVDLIDLGSGQSLTTLPTGRAPHEIAVSPDGRLAVVTNYGDRSAAGSSLTVIDIERAMVVRTIELGPHTRPHGAAFLAPNRIAVTTEGSASLLIVDPVAGSIVSAIPTGQSISHMVAVVPGLERAFVANIGSGSVTAIDLATGSKIADIATGDGAEGIAAVPGRNEVWVGNRGADTLSVIDPQTLTIEASIPCPGFPIRVAMTADGSRALVSAAASGEIVLLDVAERRELTRTGLALATAPDAAERLFGDRFGESPVPVGIVVSPRGDRAWVAATQADAVVVIDPTTLAVVGVLQAGHEPDGMAYSPVDLGAR